MSMRTILEINHDYSHAIKNDPDGFVLALVEHLRSAGNPRTIDRLRLYGVAVVDTVHHSTDRKVVIMGKEYPL